jgi:tetratricopeptide (TPR) repeat protein
MKKYFFLLLGLFVFTVSLQAQDGKKLLKQASKSISKFISDPANNAAKLQEAIDNISQALEDDKINGTSKAWNTKGDIYSAYADHQIKTNILDPSAKFTEPKAAILAYQSFLKALELAVKKGETKDALNGITDTEAHLNNTGVAMYSAQAYGDAYENFSLALDAFKTLKANERDSRLDDPEMYKDQIFFTSVAGYYGDHLMDILPHLEEMRAAGTDQAFVYEALYTAYKDTDEEKAVKCLEEGRVAFPDDTGMLFAEINHYLKAGKLEVLIDKLKLAMEKEPDNVTIYTTIGNVYDNLHTRAKEDGNAAKAAEYFDLAKDYYSQALAKDESSFDAHYSLGALYYNKAAEMTGDLNAFANDFSKEGTKKYNDLKAVMDGIFAEALPYFEKAEALNMSDLNTLVALKEIYARQNKFDKSNSYKDRIELIKSEEQ